MFWLDYGFQSNLDTNEDTDSLLYLALDFLIFVVLNSSLVLRYYRNKIQKLVKYSKKSVPNNVCSYYYFDSSNLEQKRFIFQKGRPKDISSKETLLLQGWKFIMNLKIQLNVPVLIVLDFPSTSNRKIWSKKHWLVKIKRKCKTLPVSAETLVSSSVIAVLYHFRASFTFPCKIIW